MDKPGQKTLRSISNDWVVGDKVPIAHSFGVTEVWFNVTQGNYLVCIDPAFGENAIYTYRSDGKAQCPYHSSYTDPRGIFSPCTANTNENSYQLFPSWILLLLVGLSQNLTLVLIEHITSALFQVDKLLISLLVFLDLAYRNLMFSP